MGRKYPAFFMLGSDNNDKQVILFDGVCNLCNGVVQCVIKRDKKDIFRFASLQSEYGQQFLEENKLDRRDFHSFFLFANGKIYSKSTAALKVAGQLSAGWWLLSALLIIPPFIRDGVYNLVSKNRYRWFGRKEACWIPTKELQIKFF